LKKRIAILAVAMGAFLGFHIRNVSAFPLRALAVSQDSTSSADSISASHKKTAAHSKRTQHRTSSIKTHRSQASVVRKHGATNVAAAKSEPKPGTTRVSHRRRHRRKAWSPWKVASFGDSGADDNPQGEDPAVRQAALEGLGNLNGAIVVVDPNTGRILSIVNQRLALSGAFTPCSTIKPVVALGALNEGLITPNTELRVFGRHRMALTDALARSNNQFFYKLGEMLGFPRLSQYAHEFGLGERTSLENLDESPGKFPSEIPRGGVGSVAFTGMDVEVTPLQLAAIISTIANGGTLYYLQYPRTTEEISNFQPRVRRHLEYLSRYFPDVKAGLAAAVLYGTGHLAYNPEEQIFGKTGTCSQDGARLGWFVSYASEDHPKYVVVVLLRGGRPMFGPHAAEIAGRVYRELLVKNQVPIQQGATTVGAGVGQR
jgi:penicillin-binding protein 2